MRSSTMPNGGQILILGKDQEIDFFNEVLSYLIREDVNLRDSIEGILSEADPRRVVNLKNYDVVLIGESFAKNIPIDILGNQNIIVIGDNLPAKFQNHHVNFILVDSKTLKSPSSQRKAAGEMKKFLKVV